LLEPCRQRGAIRAIIDGASGKLGRRAQVDRRVVTLAQRFDLRIG
jgi:hypothetical protein